MAELSERPNAFKARLSKEERLAKNASPARAEGPEDTGERDVPKERNKSLVLLSWPTW